EVELREQPAREAAIKRAEKEAVRLQTATTVWAEVQKVLPKELLDRSGVLSANPPAPDLEVARVDEPAQEMPVHDQDQPNVAPKPVPKVIVEPSTPRTFSSSELKFADAADTALDAGQFVQGIDLWRAELIAVGGEELAKELRWCPALKRPTLGLVWAFAGGVPDEFDA